ncbi:cardiolipin synthase [Microbacterium marmarense]|uniref:Cardiolipin synthase n=1 Tax=Microbacterium marmarense TaxID=3122051 RepID=A0ABU8LQP5_9MICO
MDAVLGSNLIWLGAVLLHVAISVTALIVLPKHRKPTAAMAWLLAIILVPYLGILLYLLIGSIKLPKSRRDKQTQIDAIIAERVAAAGVEVDDTTWPAHFRTIVAQNQRLTKLPPQENNSAQLFGDYEQSIIEMAKAMDAAERYIHVEFFIVSNDKTTAPFFAAMEAAVARGVTVRLLADHVSSRRAVNSKATFAELDRIGVKWEWLLPVMPLKGKYQRPDLRNHRKLVVIDGKVAFMGSQNLIDRTYNTPKNIARGLKWQELVSRFEGPVVASIDAIFITDWFIETGDLLDDEQVAAIDVPRPTDGELVCQLVPSGPGYATENNLRLFLSLIHSASERVIITSPYFVPDEAMVYAITTACERGIEVQLFVSEVGDQGLVYHAQRSYYETLLEAGVRIFLYPGPFILHSKHFSIDDDVAVIGSSNMDIRSFSLNMEISMMVRGRSFVDGMRAVEQGYRDISRELTLEQWRAEPSKATFLDGVARLTSALN